MKKIKLTQGQFAIVDDADYDWLNQWKWHAKKKENETIFYARRNLWSGKDCLCFLMHRVIMGLSFKDGKQIDHINGNGLDNRRSNLRFCTNQQNQFNQKSRKNKTSKFKGVSSVNQKWMARITHNKKLRYLGIFDSEVGAAKTYDRAAIKYFGEFARLNFN